MQSGRALTIAAGLSWGVAAFCANAGEKPCPNCADLLAIPALEELPEHAFGWTFGDPQPFCKLASDSRLRRDGPPVVYRGRTYRKVAVLAGACAGHAGWVPEPDVQRRHGPMLPGTSPTAK